MRVIDVRSFDIPSDENNYDELVAFADTIANAHEFEAVPLEVLDKIRAEISTVYESLDGYDPDSLGAFVSKIDEILDKYKAETEDKE